MTKLDVYLDVLSPAAALLFGFFLWLSARFFPQSPEHREQSRQNMDDALDRMFKEQPPCAAGA